MTHQKTYSSQKNFTESKMFVPRRNMMVSCAAVLAVFLANNSCTAIKLLGLPLFVARTVAMPPAPMAFRGRGSATIPEEIPRGGAKSVTAEDTLRRCLLEAKEAGKFHVQGWRWHTMSVLREAQRLQKLAKNMEGGQELDVTRLQKAADYVVDFNLKALHRVEAMFFPWMRQRMGDSKIAQPEMVKAFNSVVENLEKDQRRLAQLGKSITHSFAGSSTNSVAHTVASQSGELVDLAKSMLEREIALVIPTVSLCVPEKDQKKFNNQVIKFLGVLEARCHLVHMHEVVADSKSDLEEELWKENIPSVPRSMIPRWKRTLYEPKASVLSLP